MKMLKSNGPNNCHLYYDSFYIKKYHDKSFINKPSFLYFVPQS